ncbi:MAG TPA: DUF4082 domain-containing protein [Thermoanaerobaculia bacterium]|nr:DUF4082 domain-containing protein [Thermoanaerobaculia bacterium]
MRIRSCLITLVLAAAITAGAPAAPQPDDAGPVHLYQIEKAAPLKLAEPLAPDAAEELLIQVDPQVVADNPRTLLIDLPGQPLLEAVRTRFDVYGNDWKSWFGTLRAAGEGAGDAGFIYLGFHGNRLSADLGFAGERYRIVGGPEVGQRLVRLADELSPPSCGLETESDSLTVQTPYPEWAVTEEPSGAPLALQEKATTTIDVLAVYPGRNPTGSPGFFQLGKPQEDALVAFVQNSIAKANSILDNSNVDAEYRLLGLVPLINPVPASGVDGGVAWLTGSATYQTPFTPRAPEPAALRDAYGADLVTLFVPFSWNSPNRCGYGNLPALNRFFTADGVFQEDMGDRAFTAVRSDCGSDDFTWAHEVGHNHGLRHDDEANNSLVDLFPHGRGYVFPVGSSWRATVMGCACGAPPLPACGTDPSGSPCRRVPYFSDPNIFCTDPLCAGVRTGTFPTAGDPGRNEAAAMRTRIAGTSGTAANREARSNTPPTPILSVSCSGLTCSFSGNGTTDNSPIPSANYFWDFGDGDTASGKNIPHTYDAAGTYRVHLVVDDDGKDSAGNPGLPQRAVTAGSASPFNPPVYEGYVEQINCRVISGWAYDQNLPNLSINVDVYRNGGSKVTVPASQLRQDLVAAGKGNGRHGFSYTPSSSWRNGQWQTASVRFPNTTTDLVYLVPPEQRTIACDVSMFKGMTPAENLSTAGQVYSVGTQFSSSRNGLITQIGFYRASGETGTNTLHLSTNNGADLVSKSASCSSAGWCWANLNPAVSVTAGTLYRVWVNTNTQQSKTSCGISGGLTTGPLTAHQGVWSTGDTFPTTGSCSNYFVDVKFEM